MMTATYQSPYQLASARCVAPVASRRDVVDGRPIDYDLVCLQPATDDYLAADGRLITSCDAHWRPLHRLYPAAPIGRQYVEGCPTCERVKAVGFGPHHDASPQCESGWYPHCSGDDCF
jgi:hypothetical protein